MSSAQRLRQFARYYLRHGLLPVPAWAARPDACCCPRGRTCPRPGKHPRTVPVGPSPADYSWKPLACHSEQEISQRFADNSPYATANLMLAIPPGIMAIDQDNDDGGRAAASHLAAELGPLPPTLSHCTPHGLHKIFATPPGWTGRAWVGKAAGNPLPPGIDLRMPGQLLLAPPSQVPVESGMASYGPPTGRTIALLPSPYLAAWTPPQPRPAPTTRQIPDLRHGRNRLTAYLSTSMRLIAEDLAAEPPGGRNHAIYTAALKTGSLLGAFRTAPGAAAIADAWPDETAEDALLASCAANGYLDKRGGLPMARSTIRSGLRNGLRNPRALPDLSTRPRRARHVRAKAPEPQAEPGG